MIAAARTAGLAFVAITDHNNLDAKPLEGYRDGVLVLVGSELSTPAGHVLGLGLDRDPPFRFNGDALDAMQDVERLGGTAFAAHPFSARADLRFTAWDTPGPWGIELLNGDSEWRRAGPRLLPVLLLYRLNPGYALLRGTSTPDEALARWDEMLKQRDVVGLAGADAHSRLPLTRRRSLRFPSYEALFSLFRLHVVLDRPLSGDACRRPCRSWWTRSVAGASTSGSTRSPPRTTSRSWSRAGAARRRWGRRWRPRRTRGPAPAAACPRARASS